MKTKSSRLLWIPGVAALALTACISDHESSPEKAELAVAAITTYSTNITFEDPEALAGIPGIATNDHPYCFAPHRYKQRVEPSGASRLHMYMSEGLLPFPVQNDTNGFEIGWDKMCRTPNVGKMGYKSASGACLEMTTSRPRYHKGSNGQEWLGAYVSGPGGIRAFNLMGIQVKGTNAIHLAYKTSAGAWQTITLAPGTHSFVMTNIKEFQIRAASNNREHAYSVDNIRIQYTP